MSERSLVVIEAVGIAKQYRRGRRDVCALAPTDLTLAAGELVVVAGPSLSGKTTLLNLLAGWEAPDAGTVSWPGASARPPRWHDVAVVPQAFALLGELTVAENVTLPSRLAGLPVDAVEQARVCGVLDLSPLLNRGVDEISVGERQRTMVARALLTGAPILLADDPVAHQDRRRAAAVLSLLADAAAAGAAVVLASRTPLDGLSASQTLVLSVEGRLET